MMRTLQGQRPKVQSILTKPQVMSFEQLSAVLDENCNEDSDGWFNVGIESWADKEYLDQFFLRPAPAKINEHLIPPHVLSTISNMKD